MCGECITCLQKTIHFSSRHKTLSRIDCIVISAALLPSVHSIEFLPRHVSDHNSVISTFNYGKIKNKDTRWKFNSTLLKKKKKRNF